MDLLLLAIIIGPIGGIMLLGGTAIGRILLTIQLFRSPSLSFIDQVKLYLPDINLVFRPKKLIRYLRSETYLSFVFFGALLILIAAAMVVIIVFWRGLG